MDIDVIKRAMVALEKEGIVSKPSKALCIRRFKHPYAVKRPNTKTVEYVSGRVYHLLWLLSKEINLEMPAFHWYKIEIKDQYVLETEASRVRFLIRFGEDFAR